MLGRQVILALGVTSLFAIGASAQGIRDVNQGVLMPGEMALLGADGFGTGVYVVFAAPDSLGPAAGTLLFETCYFVFCGYSSEPAPPAGYEFLWGGVGIQRLYLVAGDYPLAYAAVVFR